MPKSMTGFAEAEGKYAGFQMVWRLRSVNHRFLDLSFRQPDNWPGHWPDLEAQASKYLRALFSRGHLTCDLRLTEEVKTRQKWTLNADTLEAVLQLEEEVILRAGMESRARLSLNHLLLWPGLMQEPPPLACDTQDFSLAVLDLLDKAALDLVACRTTEGEALAQIIQPLLDDFFSLLDRVESRLPILQRDQTARLQSRVSEWAGTQVKKEELARELAILLNRLDISEELQRLRLHLKALRLALSKQALLGRRLDFFCQELNREANTLTSKSQDAELTQIGVDMKLVVEKIREQAQNLE